MRYLVLLFSLILLSGCGKQPQTAPVKPRPVPTTWPPVVRTVDDSIKQAIASETSATILPLHRMEEEFEKEVVGVQFEAPARQVDGIRKSLSEKLKPMGCKVFVAQRNYGTGGRPDRIAVIKTADQYASLWAKETNGANYNIDTASVVRKLKDWDRSYGIEIIGADYDWVEVLFLALPPDVDAFAAEIYKFCPDSVEQGAGTVGALADQIRKEQGLVLWWD